MEKQPRQESSNNNQLKKGEEVEEDKKHRKRDSREKNSGRKRRHRKHSSSRSRSRSGSKSHKTKHRDSSSRHRRHRRSHHKDNKHDDQRKEKNKDRRQKRRENKAFNEMKKEQEQQALGLTGQEMKQFNDLKDYIKEAQREVQEQKRDQLTVLVLQIPLKAREKDIYRFFASAKCGKIRDIRLIRDPRSGISKGIAYVEFFDENSVMRGISLNGKGLKGFEGVTLKVQPSQAEKNRAAQAAKKLKQAKNAMTRSAPENHSKRIYVGGLVKDLAEIEKDDLISIFKNFGEVESVDIYKDPMTGKCLGFAFIQYTTTQAARKALKAMKGFQINDQPIKVTEYQPHHEKMEKGNFQLDLDTDGPQQYLQTAASRALLSQKLTRQNNNNKRSSLVSKYAKSYPTSCVLLINMFKQSDIDYNDKTYFSDLKYSIKEEMRKYGHVKNVHIDEKSNGTIWVEFRDIDSATKASSKLNNKYFNQQKIECHFVDEKSFPKN